MNRGKGATKQIMYNCAMWLRVQEHKTVPTWRWFQQWLKATPELYTIKTKPITSHRVDMYTKENLRDWFKKEYRQALEFTGIKSGKYIYNIDEKGARIVCPVGEEVVVPIGIKEMYIGVLENCCDSSHKGLTGKRCTSTVLFENTKLKRKEEERGSPRV